MGAQANAARPSRVTPSVGWTWRQVVTVDNPNVIDFVAHDPKADVVLLVLVEHRDWGPDGLLLPDLQAKLNTYLSYVADGQFASEYPDFRDKPICFDLRTAYPLGP